MATTIACENPWCASVTRTHRSQFAKRKCDDARDQKVVTPPTLISAPPTAVSLGTARAGSKGAPMHLSRHELLDAHMEGALLNNCDLEVVSGTNLAHSHLSSVRLDGGVQEASFEGASASGLTLSRFVNRSSFDRAKLSGFTVEHQTEINESTFAETRMNDSDWGAAVRIEDSSFRWAKMRRAAFDGHVVIRNCDLTGVDLSNARLSPGNGKPGLAVVNCELDMANFSGVDARDMTLEEVDLSQRIYFVDFDTLPPMDPASFDPSPQGQEFMTRALTEEQFAEYSAMTEGSEAELRAALERLSPAFMPVYKDGTVGVRGELVGRAISGHDIDSLVAIQAELWEGSRDHNPMLVESATDLYS